MKNFVFISLFILFGCSGGIQPASEPDDVLSEEKMVDILSELSIYETYYQQKYQHVAVYHSVVRKTGNRILKKYGTTQDVYLRSFDYYAKHHELLDRIYQKVLENLNKEAKRLGEENLKNQS